jgi:hypothetical protein
VLLNVLDKLVVGLTFDVLAAWAVDDLHQTSLHSLTAAPYPLVPGRERRASHRVLVVKNEPALRLSKPKVSLRQRVRQTWVGFACRADSSATPAPVIDHAVLLWQLRSLLRPCDRLPSPIRACLVFSRP